MTKEEAAELVLRGPELVVCSNCEGAWLIPVSNPHSLTTIKMAPCGMCKGYGVVYDLGWVAACVMLGKPVILYHERVGLSPW